MICGSPKKYICLLKKHPITPSPTHPQCPVSSNAKLPDISVAGMMVLGWPWLAAVQGRSSTLFFRDLKKKKKEKE